MELALRLSAVLTKAAIKAKSEALMKRSPSEGKRAEAVSYTHLRAHETVLDLVCRLLLEKKKTPNTHTLLYDLFC